MTQLTLGAFRKLTHGLPDKTKIFYEDPNFSGVYDREPTNQDIEVVKLSNQPIITIAFPFEDAID